MALCDLNTDLCLSNDSEDLDLYYTDIIIGRDVKTIVNNVLVLVEDGTYKINNYIFKTISGIISEILSCGDTIVKDENLFFGGDTFIGRFSLKRKHSFFSKNTFNLPNGTDFNYSLVPNVAYPTYFFNTVPRQDDLTVSTINDLLFPIVFPTKKIIDNLSNIWNGPFLNVNIIKSPDYKFDCYDTDNDLYGGDRKRFIINPLSGIIYTSYYGVISFIAESDVNLDLRSSSSLEDTFYPKQSNLDQWLQEKNVPIITDNIYTYDFSYSKQPKEKFHYQYDINFKGQQDCKTQHNQRVIYTSQSDLINNSDNSDNFLINRALDYWDFSKTGGKLVSIEALEGDKVLVRQENISNVFGAYIEINTNQETALISVGAIFSKKPIQYANATLGYFGSQHKAILHTPFGHISVDAKRGNVFMLSNGGQGLEEISNQGLKHWFKENLPFSINEQFKVVNIDNAFNGIGLLLCFDMRFNCFYLTKLDYESKSDDVRYNESLGKFYLESSKNFISLQDKKYFKNKSWTISYNFYSKSWVSWHSFTPNYYIEHIDNFDSGNKEGLWKHNISNKSFQVYYNKLYPFIVEPIQKREYTNNIVSSLGYYLDVYRYFNKYDYFSNEDISFNKAVVYNRHQNSGLLELEVNNNNLQKKLSYPIKEIDKTKIELKIKENVHNFNQFKNLIKEDYQRLPQWLLDVNNVNKQLNIQAFNYGNIKINNDYIRSNELKVRLINDKYSNFKFIFKGLINNDGTSIR
jgi:hypothetical protein